MSKTAIKTNRQTPIKPAHIDTERHFFNSVWQHSETESSARAIVDFCQKRKSWTPFQKSDLDKHWDEDVWFNKLGDYITEKNGIVALTVEFVAACYACSPKKGQQ